MQKCAEINLDACENLAGGLGPHKRPQSSDYSRRERSVAVVRESFDLGLRGVERGEKSQHLAILLLDFVKDPVTSLPAQLEGQPCQIFGRELRA